MKRIIKSSLLLGGLSVICVYNAQMMIDSPYSVLYEKIVMPLLLKLDPETSHTIAKKAISYGLYPISRKTNLDNLKINVFEKQFDNPIGLGAGFDKNGEIYNSLYQMGFGFVEIGTITPRPQSGNDKPRIFRYIREKYIVNLMGFNNDGLDKLLINLKKNGENCILGINLGKNKQSATHDNTDYLFGLRVVNKHCDYIVLNVSSPNTPNLRLLQGKDNFERLLSSVCCEKRELKLSTPILIKLSPDLSYDELSDITSLSLHYKIDGIIMSNTTIARTQLQSNIEARGGLSGEPLFNLSNEKIKQIYELTNGRIPIIGVGGIFTGEDAYIKLRAGASLVQIYSSFIFGGVRCLDEIKRDLSKLIKDNGYNNVEEIIGIDTNIPKHNNLIIEKR